MSIALDIALAAIILLCGWRGFRTGIINSVLGIVAIIVAIYGADLLSTAYSVEFRNMLEPFAGGVVDSAVAKVLAWDGAEGASSSQSSSKTASSSASSKTSSASSGVSSAVTSGTASASSAASSKTSAAAGGLDSSITSAASGLFRKAAAAAAEPPVVRLTEQEKADPERVAYAVFRQLGLLSGPSRELALLTSSKADTVGNELSDEIASRLCERTAFVSVFTLAFILISIVFSVIGNIFDLSFGLPGHENINHITGAVLGLARGVLIVLVIACVCRYLCLVISEKTIDGTRLLKPLMENNKLAVLLGI